MLIVARTKISARIIPFYGFEHRKYILPDSKKGTHDSFDDSLFFVFFHPRLEHYVAIIMDFKNQLYLPFRRQLVS